MIPKIIHWCWLSDDPIPESLQKCMDSWKVYLPDYEFIHWNFDRFPRGKSKWVDEAFDNKKYAFAADYIRLYALYNYGGIYLDMDVEVCKPFDPLLSSCIMLGKEASGYPEVAAFGVEKGAHWIKICLDRYSDRHFILPNGKLDTYPLPMVVNDVLRSNNYKFKEVISPAQDIIDNVIPIYPSEFFGPKSHKTKEIIKTENTYAIHHFAASWINVPNYVIREQKFWNSLGMKNHNLCAKIHWKILKPIAKIFAV